MLHYTVVSRGMGGEGVTASPNGKDVKAHDLPSLALFFLSICFHANHRICPFLVFFQPTTLPQGTINMNQCSDVIDGESRTGQKNSLCILTPDKEHFIRAECKEIING